MTLETFFEKFDQFADAPDAVAKMRELVLRLAVQGKLVDQLPSEEPADKLLEQIKKSKDRPIKEYVIRRQVTDPIGDDIAPFPIPQSWAWTRLGEIGDWGSGSTPARGSHGLYGGGITWLKSGELNDNQALAGSSETITELALNTGSFRRNQPGDVLFAMYGATIGKVAILAEAAVTNQAVCGCTPFQGVSNRYLFTYLVSQRTAFHEASEGGAQPNLSKVKIVAFPFPLPPLAEQKRIVAKVDELMALCDRLEKQQQERESRACGIARASLARFAAAPTPANLPFLFHPSYAIPPADLRKSILTLAVQGKLVPQDRHDEDARAMIDRAMEMRQQTIKSKSLRRKELDETADLFEHEDLPASWCVERFANLVDPENTISYGVLVPGNDVPDGIPFVRAQDLCLSNHPARPNKTIAPEIEKPYARTRLIGGEILLCVVGSIGKLGVVPDSWAGANIARAVARIKPIPDVLRDYLLLVLQEQSVQSYFTSTTRTLAQPTLNVGLIEQTPIPLPPLAEQRRIVAKVEQLMALVDELETQLAASRATAANLLSALVAELTSASANGAAQTSSGQRPGKTSAKPIKG